MFTYLLETKSQPKLFEKPSVLPVTHRQLRISYAHIWILTQRLEIRALWRTHIFKAIKIVDGHLADQRNQIGKIRNAKLCLPNHIPVGDAEWF